MASRSVHGPILEQYVKEVNYEDIKKIKCVGSGTFGQVWKALWEDKLVAVKFLRPESTRETALSEIKQLSRVSHPNIVALYAACTKSPNICLVLEFAEDGSLYDLLHSKPHIVYKAEHAMSWALQCAQGVAYLHNMSPKPLIHRDLKPLNLVLVESGLKLKICDFGTVADKATFMTNNKGSAAWMAPEVFVGSSYTEKCDVFSWGIILWEVLSRDKPYKSLPNNHSIMWTVHNGVRPPLIENCPPPIERLMTRCWHITPSERPSMQDVVDNMRILCKFFPRNIEPLVCNGNSIEDEECDQNVDSSDSQNSANLENSPSEQSFDGYWSNVASSNEGGVFGNPGFNGSARFAANPDARFYKPLEIHVRPDAWDIVDHEDVNAYERKRGAGLDEFIKQGNSAQSGAAGGGAEERGGVEAGGHSPSHPPTTPPDPTLDSMHMMLDPDLRPLTPDLSSPESVQIFQQHKQLAQEYLKVQTDLGYLMSYKAELLSQLADEELKEKKEIMELENERDSLTKVFRTLKKQSEMSGGAGSLQHDDAWTLITDTLPHE